MHEHRPYTGRARTVLVLPQAERSILSTFIATRGAPCDSASRVRIVGPVILSEQTDVHVRETVLTIVDRIFHRLGVPPKKFDLSVVNLGVASSMDRGLRIEGYSADVPIFLALIAAGLGIRLPQDVLCTGHIASTDGEIAPVQAIPAKLQAAVSDASVNRFIHPDYDSDESMRGLAPEEREKALVALINARDALDTTPVKDINQLLRVLLPEESVVLASFREGFFRDGFVANPPASALDGAISFLMEDLENRFLNELERTLMNTNTGISRELLTACAKFHIRRGKYPAGFGGKCLQVVQSIPPAVRRFEIEFPLLDQENRMQLRAVSSVLDYDDVGMLDKAVDGNLSDLIGDPYPLETGQDQGPEPDGQDPLLATLLRKIGRENLTHLFSRPADIARESFRSDRVVARSRHECYEVISSFYLHMLRHTGTLARPRNPEEASNDALALVDRAFAKNGGYLAAIDEALTGAHGGLRYLLNVMTDQFKRERQEKYVTAVFRQILDMQDPSARNRLTRAFLKAAPLPQEFKDMPPERFSEHCEELVRIYIKWMDFLNDRFRSL